MIRGVGIDVVEVARIAKAMDNPRFVEKVLSPNERREGVTPSFIAGRWAAKEAVAKAISAGLSWHDVEVHNDSDGRPSVRISESARAKVGIVRETDKIHISISHERDLASAVAVWESEE